MKKALPAFVLALSSVTALAQIQFSATDLPQQIGAYSRAYVSTGNVAVASLPGAKGGPQRWDFSYAQGVGDHVRRLDLVAPTDGGHGADFPEAAYAERTTREASGSQSWEYYRIIPTQGRTYYGFYDPVSNAADPVTVFDAPTIDLPETIALNQSWQRTVDFTDLIDIGFIQVTVLVKFTSEAVVDAYGTVVLPAIGEVPALRVNEVNTYETFDLTLGLPLDTQIFRNYYWLVKDVGKAVHIISKPETTVPPENFQTASTVLRVFESSAVKPPPLRLSVKNLRAALKGKELFLTWDKESPATGYEVEFVDRLAPQATWSPLPKPTDNFLFDPLIVGPGSRFYRVFFTQ